MGVQSLVWVRSIIRKMTSLAHILQFREICIHRPAPYIPVNIAEKEESTKMAGFNLRTLWQRANKSYPSDYVSDVRDRPSAFDEGWQTTSRNKRDDLRSRIPEEWLLREELPDKNTTSDFTGEFVELTLDEREIEITESDVADILRQTTSGEWSAREVTRAFCHRAAVAHQLVCDYSPGLWSF